MRVGVLVPGYDIGEDRTHGETWSGGEEWSRCVGAS